MGELIVRTKKEKEVKIGFTEKEIKYLLDKLKLVNMAVGIMGMMGKADDDTAKELMNTTKITTEKLMEGLRIIRNL